MCLLSLGMGTSEQLQNGATVAAQTAPDQYLNMRAGVEYVGDEACRPCHASVYETFKGTGMGRSVSVPSAEDLRELTKSVKIIEKKQSRVYSSYVRDGKIIHEESEIDAAGRVIFSESHEIAYSVGAGDVGKSYLVARGDALFVSPISYYQRIGGFDLSPGYAEGTFRGFTRRVVELCVDCHTGMPRLAPGGNNRFQQPPFRFLTVGCERCHGPGSLHVMERTLDAQLESTSDTSIVNPGKLQPEVRDDVCAQCHFAGDARVLQPGKNYLDYRPGMRLGNVVAIFSVPQKIKGNRFVALDQFEELKMSRCWTASNGRLGCISCHDPHVQLQGGQAADFFRDRCLTCHTAVSCRAAPAMRQATSPSDNCIQCHMPKQPSENIGHSSITDHRVLRTQSEVPAILQSSAPSTDLIYDTKCSASGDAQANLRNLALAYEQIAPHYPELGTRGLAVLEQAVAALPADAELQAAYGMALRSARPRELERAAEALQKAIDLGSQSPEVRTQLARLRLQQEQVTAAMELYKQSIKIEPFFTPAYLDLAEIYSTLQERKNALEMLDAVLKLDPGNDAARKQWLKIRAEPEKK